MSLRKEKFMSNTFLPLKFFKRQKTKIIDFPILMCVKFFVLNLGTYDKLRLQKKNLIRKTISSK